MFELDPRIARDSVLITELSLCQVRLQNDARYPWFVLVPKVAEQTEVHELTQEQQTQLMKESSLVASALKKLTQCDKVNIANLGNVVSQLHWHVVARFKQDETWPGPIWGVGQAVPYTDEQIDQWREKLLAEL
jgi:diadenosine tetraphosphate (Ap4A) HIT family hydrolase|tara:strand:+ start:422 stop:820 length:399 start_codon:yes stop_codon:yes gene_type:complete